MATNKDKQVFHKENVSSQALQLVTKGLKSRSRRTVIRKLAVGSAALAGCSFIPHKWAMPLVEFGTLPAHAQTSSEIITDPEVPATEAESAASVPDVAASGSGNFSLVFVQTVQPCASCGIWFDSIVLEIVYGEETFSVSQPGFLVKKTSGKQGSFGADISSIPVSASIQSATLYMHLNPDEGIANSDNGSVINVYDYSSGSRGEMVRTITAADDIKGAGYSKSNPNVPIDFTDYAKQVHGQ